VAINASWNPDTYDYYLKRIFQLKPEYETTLLNDFITYKSGLAVPNIFGRDELYVDPDSITNIRMAHIHLATTQKFKPITSKYYQYERTSDAALVYVRHHFDENAYSLLAIFPHSAHTYARDYPFMEELAKYAEKFCKNPVPPKDNQS